MCVKSIVIGVTVHVGAICAFEGGQEFRIHQEASRRTFTVSQEGRFLGAVLSSDYGRLDFYDADHKRIHVNHEDVLFDDTDKRIGLIRWEKDEESKKWFWQRKCMLYRFKTHLIFYEDADTPVFTLDEEGAGHSFVFREYETKKPLAVALWSWSLLGNSSIAAFDDHVQDWNVILVNSPLMEEKNISFVSLIWTLLKHSQLHFPSPSDYPFEPSLNSR
jgi:hypothetical protein